MTLRLIKPLGHPLFVAPSPAPSYVACTGDSCGVCSTIRTAQNLQQLDLLIKKWAASKGL